jgi:hypothetical protein
VAYTIRSKPNRVYILFVRTRKKKKKEKERGIEREWDCQGDEAPQYLIEES